MRRGQFVIMDCEPVSFCCYFIFKLTVNGLIFVAIDYEPVRLCCYFVLKVTLNELIFIVKDC